MPGTSCPSRGRAVAVVALSVLAVVTGLGCGAGGSPALHGAPMDVIHAAPDRMRAVGTAKVTVSMGVATGPGLVGAGVVDFGQSAADITFRRTGAAAKTRDVFRVVVNGATGYVSGAGSPGSWSGGLLPAVASAMRARIAPLDDLLVRPGAGLALAFLRGARNVLPYGGEEVEGASTLRYSFVVDLGTAVAASPPAEQPALRAAAQAIGNIEEPADVWLDSAGRVRRVQFATNPMLRTTTTRGSFFAEDGEFISFIVIDFGPFGVPATITAPPSADVKAVS